MVLDDAQAPTLVNIPTAKQRFVFIDGLRGIAAVGVMFHHLYTYSELQGPLMRVFPRVLTWPMENGARGVQIFFVISGFVIAYSLRGMKITPRAAGNFILRRQIRLDPTYWVAVIGTLLYLLGQAIAHPEYRSALPSAGTVLLNLIYLQNIAGRQPISLVAWTLCLEIQFYLVYILILLLVQQSSRALKWGESRHGTLLLSIITPLFLLSLWLHVHETAESPYFINTWHLFAMGVLCCWAMQNKIKVQSFLASLIVAFAAALFWRNARVLCGCATAALIFTASRTGGLTTWLGNALVQYFGRISYSLYLVHIVVGRIALRLGMHAIGKTPASAVIDFVLATFACVGAAHLLHRLVEQPTMKWAARLKPRRAQPVALTS